MIALLRTILIILVIYYAFRFIGRIVFPFILRTFINRTQQNMQERMKDMHEQHPNKKEGEITVDFVNKKKTNDSDGEYVDYEEIK